MQCGSATAGAQCLAPAEVAAAKRIYAGLVDPSGVTQFPGTGVASEPLWAAYASPQFSIGTNYFRNVVINDASWDPATFDLARDLARAATQDAGAADAMNPDLSSFVARGGKLLLYHGTTDGLIPYGNTLNYYHSVVEKLGLERTDEHVKLYLVPGMDHCAGGEGAHQVDWQTAIEDWLERGVEPGTLASTHPAVTAGPPGTRPSTAFTRPACVYPTVVRYKGSGDTTDAANFECVEP
jgi:feruloyl esterase